MPFAIVLRLTPCGSLDRQPKLLETSFESMTRLIDGCGIFEGCLRLPEDLLQSCRIVCQKEVNILSTLVLIAAGASQSQVADAVTAATRSGNDVIDL